MSSICLIGLGNPGQQFEKTRHNLGKRFLIWLVEQNTTDKNPWKKEGLYWSALLDFGNNRKILCVITQTYMNESGKIMQPLKTHLESDSILCIAHDDLELAFGKSELRTSKDRGLRGHNGLRSIQNFLKEKPYFFSLGIDRPENEPVNEYVLRKFPPAEEKKIENSFIQAEQELMKIFTIQS